MRRAARVLAAQHGNRPLACALAGPAGRTGFAVLVSGDAAARVMLADGREVRIGGDPHGAADRVVEGPVASLELTLPGAGRAEPRLRLGSGVTRGGGCAGRCGARRGTPRRGPTSRRRAGRGPSRLSS
ncbi:hypothetical protein ACFQY7_06235 [Actinomadura luteofluorescens]|uniref:hypothetical protein n=1 Tax=Actinomadura luteofluorescens TaxID=46163 RepID=UPI00363F8015